MINVVAVFACLLYDEIAGGLALYRFESDGTDGGDQVDTSGILVDEINRVEGVEGGTRLA
jgi:hypothetical protein